VPPINPPANQPPGQPRPVQRPEIGRVREPQLPGPVQVPILPVHPVTNNQSFNINTNTFIDD
jgi:hypothetical protein